MGSIRTPVRKLRFIPGQIATHAEELAYLRSRLRASLASPALTIVNIQDLQERCEAHVQGLVVAGPDLLSLVSASLEADDRDEVFAAAYGLLRTQIPAFAQRVIDAFMSASGNRLTGLADALGAVQETLSEAALLKVVEQGDARRAAHAGLALANRRCLYAGHPRLATLLGDEDTAIALLAWRVAALLDEPGAAHDRPYALAARSEDVALREAAFHAGAWHGESWVLPALAQLAQRGDLVGWRGLAALGDARCVPLLTSGLQEEIPLALRAPLAARWGHPVAIEHMLAQMRDADPVQAAAAGDAFTRMTGFDVEGRRETPPVAEDTDVFAREFAEDVWLPDIDKAQRFWTQHAERWQAGARWCRGFEITASLPSAAQQQISMQARWDFGARAALSGARIFAPPPAL
ncbi:hypothetical protein VVD49_13805 [Uliginosibacterium sp. H3]|uniref:TIGR02270 family protein n=1 Tax=Uliginosibacterium silvisoli TaxID=3114758 RepID=A0ABU6K737_9RHOO|nr:hypothetical protein [Uliginosibacterium sp. H3]